MKKTFTLEYWIDEGWYVGRIKEIPGVFSQGEDYEELVDNIHDAYKLMMQENVTFRPPKNTNLAELDLEA